MWLPYPPGLAIDGKRETKGRVCMKIGYVGVSKQEQNEALQVDALQEAYPRSEGDIIFRARANETPGRFAAVCSLIQHHIEQIRELPARR